MNTSPRALPANAIVITGQESGSVRFYSNRDTMVWRALPSDGLDDAMTFARAHGYRPYLLIETGEQQEFVDQFAGKSPLGGLGWPRCVDINHMLQIYDPEDFSRYRAGSGSGRSGCGQKRAGHSLALSFSL